MKRHQMCQYPGCDKRITGRKRKWCAEHEESGPMLNSRERQQDLYGPITDRERERLALIRPDRVTISLTDYWLNVAGRMPDSASGEVEGEALL